MISSYSFVCLAKYRVMSCNTSFLRTMGSWLRCIC